MTKRNADTSTAPVVEALPQEGGSYTRQPDGSLVSNEPALVQEAPVEPTTPAQE